MTTKAQRAQGFTLAISDGQETPAFLEIGEIMDVPPVGGEASEIDVTSLGSTSREFLLGLRDSGTGTVNCNYVKDDVGQLECRSLQASGEKRELRGTFADGSTFTVLTLIKTHQVTGAVDEQLKLAIGFRFSGDVTYA